MSSVDNRIVNMKFENSQFESGAKESISTLEKLKRALKFDKSADSLDKVNNAAKDHSGLDAMSNALSGVSKKTVALGTIGITVLSNLTNRAVDAGMRIAKALTIQPVVDGFNEYELKVNSMRTIMASTGESVGTVNKYLNELNKYSDQTIYKFSDMTQNIGKFTNAGVKLKDAVAAIKGISNEAALAGASASEASHAMYNFAQALSSGYVKLIDWKSIEVANMATKGFKEQLLKTAEALGTVKRKGNDFITTTTDAKGKISDAFNATKGFNDSLSHQWMTSKVLIETLKKYADANTKVGAAAFHAAQDINTFTQLVDTTKEALGSLHAHVFEVLFGNIEEAKGLWSSINSLMTGSTSIILNNGVKVGGALQNYTDAVTNFWDSWAANGGRQAAIQTFFNVIYAVESYVAPFKEAINNLLPGDPGKQFAKLTVSIEHFTSKLIPSKQTVDSMRGALNGISEPLHQVLRVLSTVGKSALKIAQAFIPSLKIIGGGVVEVIGNIGSRIAKFAKDSKAVDKIVAGIQKGTDAVAKFIEKWTVIGANKLRSGSIKALGDAFDYLSKKIQNAVKYVKNFTDWKELGNNIIDKILSKVDKLNDALQPFIYDLSRISKSKATAKLTELTKGISTLSKTKSINPISFMAESMKVKFSVLFSNLKTQIANAKAMLSSLGSAIKGLIAKIPFDKIKAGFQKGFAGLGAGLYVYEIHKFIKMLQTWGDAFKGISGVGKSVSGFFDTLSSSIKKSKKVDMAKYIAVTAVSLVLLAGAVKQLSGLEFSQVGVGLTAIAGVLAALLVAAKAIAGMDIKGEVLKAAVSMTIMAFGISRVASALIPLASVDPSSLMTAVAALSVIIGVMTAMTVAMANATKVTEKMGKTTFAIGKMSAAFIAISASLILMSAAFKIFSTVDTDKFAASIAAMSVCFAAMLGFVAVVGLIAKLGSGVHAQFVSAGVGLLAMAAGIMVLAGAVVIFAKIKTDTLVTGLQRVAVVLGMFAALGMIANAISGSDFALMGVGMIGFATGLIALAGAVALFAMIPLESMIQGLVGIAGAMVPFIALGVSLQATAPSLLAASVAMVAFAASVIVLSAAVEMLGAMNPASLVSGLVAVISVMAALALVTNSLNGSMAGAVSLLAVAAGVSALAVALALLSAVPVQGILVAGATLATLIGGLALASGLLAAATPGIIGFSIALGALAVATMLCGAGVLVLATGIASLVPVLLMLSKIDTSTLTNGLNAFLHIALAVTQATLILSAGLVAFGLAAMVAGKGLSILGAGLLKCAVAGLVTAAAITLLAGSIALFATVTGQTISQVTSSLKNAFLMIADTFLALIQGTLGKIPVIGSGISKALGPLRKSIADELGKDDGSSKNSGKKVMESYKQGISEGGKGIKDAAKKAGGGSAIKAALKSDSLRPTGQAKIGEYASGIKSGGSKVQSASRSVGKQSSKGLKQNDSFKSAAKSNVNSYISAFTGAAGGASISSAGKRLGTSSGKGAKNSSAFRSSATSNVNAYKSAISSQASKATSSGKTLGKRAASGAKQTGAFKTSGANDASGFISGIASPGALSRAYSAGAKLAQAANKGFRDNDKQASPSKLYRKFGQFDVKGLIMGLGSMDRQVYNAGGKLSRTATSGFQRQLGRLSSMAEDLDATPRITPVIDTSQISRGVNQINGMFGSTALAGTVSAEMSSKNQNGFASDAAFAKLVKDINNLVTNPGQVTNNITISGAGEDPQVFANRLVNTVQLKLRSM